MSKFISIPGMSYSGERNRQLPRHPGASEYYANRDETSHDASGFDVGQVEHFRGDACKVLHEEKDQHTGEVHTYVQRSVRGDAGLYKVTWAPDGPRSMVIRSTRRTS